ncbi:Aste57867_8940 [Aphanomyces stellatus]|uniref:Aste57867_8940 protein n=1 Tax=Aphanomyces stellatus TaxID=120398 RepID=A0A485KLM4_9STRA|nr:hypothetical protein As57867_008905 [Aphanomyces stellatus]VFT85824.1 Aste57867_8940 [Aphanomyces stellatus]
MALTKMPIVTVPATTTTPEKKSLKHKVTNWFKAIVPTKSKCTCPKHTVSPHPKKEKKSYYVAEPIQMPRKYANEARLYSYVGGLRVPYIPSQISQLKDARTSYDPIDEEHILCAHCQEKTSRLTITAADDDDDY